MSENKTTPHRIQRRRVKGWRMPEGAVYVGRPSVWQNPFGLRCTAASIPCDTIEDAVKLHRDMVAAECTAMRRVPNYIWALRGKVLACWCRIDQPCHADLLLRIANGPPMSFPDAPAPTRVEDARQEELANV